MQHTYRPRIQAKTVQDMARRMVQFKGRAMSPTAFHKFLEKDKDLHHIVYRSGTMSQHEAKQFLKSLAKKVDGHEQMDFSLFAKKHNLASTSGSGELSDIAARRAYEMGTHEEIVREAPKGPTKADLEKMKMEERKKKLRNLMNRQLADLMDKKQSKISSFSPFKHEPKESQAQISAAQPNRMKSDDESNQKNTPGVSIPALEHTTAFTQFSRSDADAEPFVVNPHQDQKQTEAPNTPVSEDDVADPSSSPETPSEQQLDKSADSQQPDNDVHVDEELPL